MTSLFRRIPLLSRKAGAAPAAALEPAPARSPQRPGVGEPELTARQRKRLRRRMAKRQQRSQSTSSGRRNRIVMALVLAGIVTVVIYGLTVILPQVSAPSPGQSVPDLGVTHIRPGEAHEPYNSDPPTSGPHFPGLEAWGVYREPIVPEQQIHYLEHGGIILHYNCQDCPEEVETLTQLVRSYGSDRLILHPYPAMDSRFALTAWAKIDKFDGFDEGRFRAFIEAYRGRLGREARDPLQLPIR
ncbi:MAG: DUF3105 domain-containing protein [Chloroflexi bacterium]|nr:DUF3105 domain-containing protein [Chloroflexota bacterium]